MNFSIRDGIKPKYGDNHTAVLWSALLGWPWDGRVILGCCWLRLWSRSSPDQALAPPSTELSLPLAQVGQGACQLREDLAIFAAQQGFHKGYDWKANCPCWRTLLWQHCTPAGGHARSIAGNSALTQAVANLQV